jgi:hypothetical protein
MDAYNMCTNYVGLFCLFWVDIKLWNCTIIKTKGCLKWYILKQKLSV